LLLLLLLLLLLPWSCPQRYRDGGQGVLRPLALRLGGGPLPGESYSRCCARQWSRQQVREGSGTIC
jgi:hypothetical protein